MNTPKATVNSIQKPIDTAASPGTKIDKSTKFPNQNVLRQDQINKDHTKLKTDKKSVEKYSKIAEDILGAFNVELKFKVLTDPKGVVKVEIWNKAEDKLIRQIPSKDVINIIRHIQDMMGKLLDKKA